MARNSGQVVAPWACDEWTDTGRLIPAGNDQSKKFADDEKEQRRQWCATNKMRFDEQVKESKERRRKEHIVERRQELSFLAEDRKLKALQDEQDLARRRAENQILIQREQDMKIFVENKRNKKQRQIDFERKQAEEMQEQLRVQRQEDIMQRHAKSLRQKEALAQDAESIKLLEEEKLKELEHERRLIVLNNERMDKQDRERRQKIESIANQQNVKQQGLQSFDGYKSPRTIAREQEEQVSAQVAEAQRIKDLKESRKVAKQKKNTEDCLASIDQQLAQKKQNQARVRQQDLQFASKIKQNEMRMQDEDKKMQEARKVKQRQIRTELKEQMQEQRINRGALDHLSTRVLAYQQPGTLAPQPGSLRHRQNTHRQGGGATNRSPMGMTGRSPSTMELSTREAELLKRISDQNDKRTERVLSSLSP